MLAQRKSTERKGVEIAMHIEVKQAYDLAIPVSSYGDVEKS